MNDCVFYLLAYIFAILFAVGTLIGVALITEMMISLQLYAMFAIVSLVVLWKVKRTTLDFLFYIGSTLICYFGVTYVGICASLVMSNGTQNILGGWAATLMISAIVITNVLRQQKPSEKRNQFLSAMSTMILFTVFVVGMSTIVAIQPISPFPSDSVAFSPQFINEKTLQSRALYNSVSYSRCYAPNCNRFVFDENYSLRSERDLPEGFFVLPETHSKYSAVIKYSGNGSLPFQCFSYDIYVRCSIAYEALIGKIWIGRECATSAEPTLPCETIDVTVANYMFWFGVVVISVLALLFWFFMKRSMNESSVVEEHHQVEMVIVDDYHSVTDSQ